MAQKQDILEQIVEEYLRHEGYFVQHNIRYRPKSFKQTHSDIDVLAINPNASDPYRKVIVVNVKSWQGGFNFQHELKRLEKDPKSFRELADPEWSEAFVAEIKKRTKEDKFTYVLAITLARPTKKKGNDKALWERNSRFKDALANNPIQVITLTEMAERIEQGLTTTLAATDIGRTLQLFRAAGLRPAKTRPEPSIESDDE